MVTAEAVARENTAHAAADFADESFPREILGFFEKHARTRFDKLALLLNLDTRIPPSFRDRALRGLVEQGKLVECVENGVPFYSLKQPSR